MTAAADGRRRRGRAAVGVVATAEPLHAPPAYRARQETATGPPEPERTQNAEMEP
jgi:hypothetical protein